MSTSKIDNALDVTFSPTKKPKLNYGRLPDDFFERSNSVKIRSSSELKS